MTKPWTWKDDIEFRELLAEKRSSADYWQAEAMHRSEMWKRARAEAERYRRLLFRGGVCGGSLGRGCGGDGGFMADEMKKARELTWSGPCFELGTILRETEQFYVIDPTGIRAHSRKRIKKGPLIHIETCRRCCDHPQTDYPRGYDL